MSSAMDKEARGDWANLKGTRYHLVYALWLLLRGEADRVAFFEGNDLRASPKPPPNLDGTTLELPSVPMKAVVAEMDIWIQLKSTQKAWTVSLLLSDNLLFNFICNAISSERRKRECEIRLVTEAEIHRDEIQEFAATLDSTIDKKKRKQRKSLDGIINKAQKALAADEGNSVTISELLALARKILQQLADTKPITLETLKAQVELEMTYAGSERSGAQRTASVLVGAMLLDAADGPTCPQCYDDAWMNQEAGWVVKSTRPFDSDVTAACNMAVEEVLRGSAPIQFVPDRHVCRERPAIALRQFLSARETVFVLLGRSGVGKSWTVAEWAADGLRGQVRLLADAGKLEHAQVLGRLAVNYFDPYTSRAWREPDILRLLANVPANRKQSPGVICIDDLHVSEDTADSFRRLLRRLVCDARGLGMKVFLACQTETWNLFRLHAAIPYGEIYNPFPEAGSGQLTHSLLLGDFTREEFTAAVRQRLGPERGAQAALQLLAPGFAPLLNPYLLERYLEQHASGLGEPSHTPNPVDVDGLLSNFVSNKLEQAGLMLENDSGIIRRGFHALLDALWRERDNGLIYGAAVGILERELPGQGQATLRAFRRVGLVSTEEPVRIADGVVAGHLFAVRLLGTADHTIALTELLPARDAMVVEALVRQSASGVELAETLLRRDVEWTSVVATSLAQRSPKDLGTLALATCMSRPRENRLVGHDGCRALGTLAGRGDCAWQRVLVLFLSEDRVEALRGMEAMSIALAFVPDRVSEAVRQRLDNVKNEPGTATVKEQAERIDNVLGALSHITHREAAETGQAILRDYQQLLEDYSQQDSFRLVATVDHIRGEVATHGDPTLLTALLQELKSTDRTCRLRAAAAIRSAVFETPERTVEAVCAAIRSETDSHVLLRLLWNGHPLLETASTVLLSAIRNGEAVRWNDPVSAGPALVLLGSACSRHPVEIAALLPRSLAGLPGHIQACLADVWARAWWRCAEYHPQDRAQLVVLAESSVDKLPEEYLIFAYRGRYLAQLGVASLGVLTPRDQGVSMTRHVGDNIPFFWTEVRSFCRQNAKELVESATFPQLLERLQACIRSVHSIDLDPQRSDVQSARFQYMRLSLDDLTEFAFVHSNPVSVISDLPRDWQTLYIVANLLERGCRLPAVVQFAQQACDERANGGTATALAERNRCLAQLAKLNPSPQEALSRNQVGIGELIFGMAGEGYSQRFVTLVDSHPDQVLSLLEEAVDEAAGIPVLFNWAKQARTWRSLLIAEVFARMFSIDPIDLHEARFLTDQLLFALRGLHSCSLRAEYETVYEAIQSWLQGVPAEVVIPDSPASAIRRSHFIATDLLSQGFQAIRGNPIADWIATFVLARRCWWDTTNHGVRGRKLVTGIGHYLTYSFPAVRLAGVAVAAAHSSDDPISSLMERRLQAARAFADVQWLWLRNVTEIELLERGVATLRGILSESPFDERLLWGCGSLLLRLCRLEEAEGLLHCCRQSPSCSAEYANAALYDLACISARRERPEECRQQLEAYLRDSPNGRQQLSTDPDFELFRETVWFQAIVNPS